MRLSDFRYGDKLVITSRNRQRDERRAARVTAVNHNGLGGITYSGECRNGLMPTGAGWFDPVKVGTKPFGLVVAVEIVKA